jgi:hypothetical protein
MYKLSIKKLSIVVEEFGLILVGKLTILQWRTVGGVSGVQTPPEIPKF